VSPSTFRPLTGAILAAALHILFRYLDYDRANPGIDAENQAQLMRARSAVSETHGHSSGPGYNSNVNYNTGNDEIAPNFQPGNPATTTTTTSR